jgi:FixJ family two-component response regulator
MPAPAEETGKTVVVIDDDEYVREAIQGLLASVGLRVRPFASVQAFLADGLRDGSGCLVLDVRLPGQSGLELQEFLAKSKFRQPIIFISGHADVAMSVRAMKAGAIEFLTKPVRDQDLLDAVQRAIEMDSIRRHNERDLDQLIAYYDTLTVREREIMAEVVTGRRNKQIAADVGVTEATVKLHRGHIMQKMRARSIVELVRMADALAEQVR